MSKEDAEIFAVMGLVETGLRVQKPWNRNDRRQVRGS